LLKTNIYNWFNAYTSAYRQSADAQTHELKYQHSIQVSKNCFQIATKESFNEKSIEIAEIIGLLHDCGRFEQYEQYQTFNDKVSVDHAALSVKVIEENKLLNSFSEEVRSAIIKSILFHNKRDIPKSRNSEEEFSFIKLIRDADKTDIFRVMREQITDPKIDKKTLLLNQSEEITYSAPIINSIQNRELANLQDMETMVDFRLIQLSWIFDINYKSTFEIIKKQGHLNWLIDTLPGKELIKDELSIIKTQLLNA
jgi:hypothetical protein